LLLWITNTLTPQEIRDKLMSRDNDFEKAMIDYLENSHMGVFLDATMNEVAHKVKSKNYNMKHELNSNEMDTEKEPDVPSEAYLFPIKPPVECKKRQCMGCSQCTKTNNWMAAFKNTVNHLVYHLNRHICQIGWCKEVKSDATCKARFPREVHETSSVDKETGHINMKKLEPYINFFSPVVTFLLRCNSDVTCLLSRTAVKAVIAYVTDYITKSSLKTHVMFDVVKNIVERK
ncbi:hypothetical protein JAAARDRAFT_106286, partial [Jaapia argillacea MUCL 33604]